MVPRAAALYLGVVQFLFATTWTVYVIYLPKLAANAGIDPFWIPWILVADQALFAIMDVATGFWVDRVRAGLARLGGWILGVTAISCAAFVLLPFVGTTPGVLLSLIFVWVITSSALRSPPWALLSRYAAKPSVPWLSTLMLSGTAVGAAIGPYLGIALRDIDPRVPFVVSNVTLLLAVGALVWVERRLAGAQPQPASAADRTFDRGSVDGRRLVVMCYLALAVMAIGFQVNFALNSAHQYRRFAEASQLAYLMPVFWIGFNVLMFPASGFVRRFGAIRVMSIAAAVGAVATLGAVFAPGLQFLVAAQFLAGGCWGAMSVAMFSAVIAFGRAGREGTMLGSLFAVIALAAFVRICAYATDMVIAPGIEAMLPWLPPLMWLIGGLFLVGLIGAARRQAI